ncbi:MAG: FAD-dependent oxidoreductase [Anaerolineae bacterium]
MVVGDLATTVDVLVLGAGPGGCAAAIRAAQLGKEVALVDPGTPGNSLAQTRLALRALLSTANQFWQLTQLAQQGIFLGDTPPRLEWGRLQSWKNRLIEQYLDGMKRQLEQVELVDGRGWFLAPHEVRIEGEYGAKRYLFDQAVIAVGAEPTPWPDLPFDGQRVLTPAQALALTEFPAQVSLIGADSVAAELATLFAKLGVTVNLFIPTNQRLLAEFDPAAGQKVQSSLEKLGAEITELSDPLPANLSGLIVVSRGLTPRTPDLRLSQAGVAFDTNGYIGVNERQQTSNPAIYAAGAVTGAPPLAHVATKQGQVAADNIAGRAAQFAPQAIPRVVYTDPPIAAVGLTNIEAEAAGYNVSGVRCQVSGVLDDSDGCFVELIAEQSSEVLLGVTVMGAQAETLIGEAALALEMGATLTDLAETLHPRGGAGEALAKAAERALR